MRAVFGVKVETQGPVGNVGVELEMSEGVR